MYINISIELNSQYKDILQLMIEATCGEAGGAEEEKESAVPAECPTHKGMTDAEVVENSILFILAGSETTATTLSFASYLLALHSDIQKKLQSEIDTYFEDKPVSSWSINKLVVVNYIMHIKWNCRILPFT